MSAKSHVVVASKREPVVSASKLLLVGDSVLERNCRCNLATVNHVWAQRCKIANGYGLNGVLAQNARVKSCVFAGTFSTRKMVENIVLGLPERRKVVMNGIAISLCIALGLIGKIGVLAQLNVDQAAVLALEIFLLLISNRKYNSCMNISLNKMMACDIALQCWNRIACRKWCCRSPLELSA